MSINKNPIYLAALFLLCAAFQNLKAEDIPLTLSRPLILKWIVEQGDPITVSPGFHGKSLYVQTSEGVVSCILLPSGQLQWRSDVGGELSTSPVADGQAVYVASEFVPVDSTRPKGVITGLSRTSGITKWSRMVTSPIQSHLLLVGNSIFGVTKAGHVFSLDAETGNFRWTTKYSYNFSGQLLLANGSLIVITLDGFIISFESLTGRQVWRYRTQDVVRGTIAVGESQLFIGSAQGYVTALEETAKGIIIRWRRRVGTSVKGVTYAAQGIIAVTADNFVQLLSHKRGSRLWKQRMPSRVFAQPLLESGNALFATPGEDACIVLSLESGKQVNFLTVGVGNNILAMPVLTQTALIIPTRLGLMAFAPPEVD